MPLAARRTFRLGAVASLALALAYGAGAPLPFLAPLLAFVLTATPAPPPGGKALAKLVLLVAATLGSGLALTPVLHYYPLTGVLAVAAGLFASTYLGVGRRQGLVSTLLTMGLTMIPAAGLVSHALARSMVEALLIGLGIAIVAQWTVYPAFPEDAAAGRTKATTSGDARDATWIALRTMVIVLPPVLMAFSNPSAYMALIMKAALLGQQGNLVSARAAGRELLGSTLLAGLCAMVFWFALKLWPGLWMFALWMLLFGIAFGRRIYRIRPTRLSPSFWLNVATTMLILLGPAVEDSASGDVYEAFVQRFVLFVAVTGYAWLAISLLDRWRALRVGRASPRRAS